MTTALIGTRLIVGDGTTVDDAVVTFDGGTITSVARAGGPVRADRVLDLGGRTLLPGLIDTHTPMVGGANASGSGDEATTFRMGEPLIKAVLDTVDAARVTAPRRHHDGARDRGARLHRRVAA